MDRVDEEKRMRALRAAEEQENGCETEDVEAGSGGGDGGFAAPPKKPTFVYTPPAYTAY